MIKMGKLLLFLTENNRFYGSELLKPSYHFNQPRSVVEKYIRALAT